MQDNFETYFSVTETEVTIHLTDGPDLRFTSEVFANVDDAKGHRSATSQWFAWKTTAGNYVGLKINQVLPLCVTREAKVITDIADWFEFFGAGPRSKSLMQRIGLPSTTYAP